MGKGTVTPVVARGKYAKSSATGAFATPVGAEEHTAAGSELFDVEDGYMVLPPEAAAKQ